MQIDNISYADLSIFHTEMEYSIFHKLNFTKTAGGRGWLKYYFSNPFHEIKEIKATQAILGKMVERVDEWPSDITNGTILVMEKFFDYALNAISPRPSSIDSFFYRIFHSEDYAMIRFSVKHFADFLRGIRKIAEILSDPDLPVLARVQLDRMEQLLKNETLRLLSEIPKDGQLSITRNLYFTSQVRGPQVEKIRELMNIYFRLDAWYSMAVAVKKFDLSFPEFEDQERPFLKAKGLYHLLLPDPVPYDLEMNPDHHFIFLTGANMAGKSTLIKSLGGAVFLAHLGMGVPAKSMRLTVFDGLITNINVMDNIAKGESFFFNEVQRVRKTVEKIRDQKKWLVLIDELFKGTNIQDAMKCSLTVIRGLVKVTHSLFVLSTHLYEIGEELTGEPTITFRQFETRITDGALEFSYQLKEGISKDRFGYLILKREGVVELLDNL